MKGNAGRRRATGTPDNYVANGRMKSGGTPSKGGGAFSGYGRSENVRGATASKARGDQAAANSAGE